MKLASTNMDIEISRPSLAGKQFHMICISNIITGIKEPKIVICDTICVNLFVFFPNLGI